MRTAESRLLAGLAALAVLLGVAVGGFRLLEGWSLTQALFFSLITITTIGYSDYDIGPGTQLFTSAVVVIGIVIWLWLVNAAIEYAAVHWSERLRRRVERALDSLRGHFIVVGYGAVGRQVVDWLLQAGRRVVVIDLDPAAVEELHERSLHCLHGDATDEETLRRAGLERAAGLLAVTRDDPVNVFVTITARSLRPDLYIAANASSVRVAERLRQAGATTAISPYALGAQRLAQAALSPHIAELFRQTGAAGEAALMLREAELEPGSELCGASLRESAIRQRTNVMIAAHRPAGAPEMVVNPPADTVLAAGDVLIAFGRLADLNRFVALVSPAATRELSCLGDQPASE